MHLAFPPVSELSDALARSWKILREELPEWLAGDEESLRAIVIEHRLVGVVASMTWQARAGRAIWIRESERGQGIGDAAVVDAIESGQLLVCCNSARDIDYYCERGFTPVATHDELIWLEPPSWRKDLRPAASVCLWHRASGSVLLGRRKTSSWHRYWAFPGGRQEVDETLVECAVRELREETGLDAVGEPLRSRIVYVGVDRCQTVYAITNFVFSSASREQPRDSDELTSAWFTLEEAGRLRPMAAGTRRILRMLDDDL